MTKRVYLETTIVSYLAAQPSRDLVVAANQELTREWWQRRRATFDIYVSQLVLDEAAGGDSDAAERRLRVLQGLQQVPVTEEAVSVAESLIGQGLMPRKAAADALHIAIAAAHQLDILLTWNCRHLANAELIADVARHVRSMQLEPPIVCTPAELMGV